MTKTQENYTKFIDLHISKFSHDSCDFTEYIFDTVFRIGPGICEMWKRYNQVWSTSQF